MIIHALISPTMVCGSPNDTVLTINHSSQVVVRLLPPLVRAVFSLADPLT
jgi:hypothetical protein